MKEKIHPNWFPEAQMTCLSCGTVWVVGMTVPERRVDICANCHPFYTGEQRIVDTEGQVDRFMKRLQERDRRRDMLTKLEEAGPNPADPIETLEIGKQYTRVMHENGLETVQDVLDRLAATGDDGLLQISGIGRKVLADIKKSLRNLGYDVPDVAVE
jgi:large subunit ribosomal protein L31